MICGYFILDYSLHFVNESLGFSLHKLRKEKRLDIRTN